MKLANVLVAVVICLIFSLTVSGQYFTLPGSFTYSLNSINQVFDISPDGKIGIALRNDPTLHLALLTTFDPILGTPIDSKTFGFGPLGVQLAQVGNSLRAVVLTSEGGPRRIYLFDVSSTGQLTQLGSTQLTPSGNDGGSNLVLSSSAQAGFVIVYSNTGAGAELISFSLVDGAILNGLPVPGIAYTLVMGEAPNKRLLAFRIGNSLKVINVLNPAQPIDLGNVPLVSNGEFSGIPNDGIAFSADGRYVFFGNQFYNFAAIDITAMQVVGTIPGNYRFGRVTIFDDNQRRLLAIQSTPSGTDAGTSAILLVDAIDPTHLSVINQYNFSSSERFSYKSDFAFSHDGLRLYMAATDKLIAFNLPGFTKAWEQPVPGSVPREQQVRVFGPTDQVLGAWQVSADFGFTSIFGAFPPHMSVNEATTVSEGDSGKVANFTITLSSPVSYRVTVNYATADGTAQKGLDYTDTSGTATFEPGVTKLVVAVPIIDDSMDEFDETFTLTISNPSPGVIINAQSIATILDDDPPPTASVEDMSVNEGNSGTSNANFVVSLSAASGKPISLSYATAGDTATADIDYSSANGTVTFSPGQITRDIVIQVKGDTLSEGNEAFFINLTNPVNVTFTDAQGIVTILDDDPPILATEENSQRAIALDSVTFMRGPFAVNNLNYFGTDQRTRIMLFATNVSLTPGLALTAQAEDSVHMLYELPVEFVTSVPQFGWLTQMVVKLPDGIVSAGDLQVSITVRGELSNKVLVGVRP